MSQEHPLLPTFAAFTVAVAATLFLVSNAWAGEFFEKDGVALRGSDPVAYFTDKKPVKGSPEHKADYKGSTFNRDIQKQWSRDIRGFVAKADENWPAASKQTKVHE